MRTRPEILQDATRRTEKGVMIPECSDKIKLLTLEVFIDIRDELTEINNSLATIEKIEYRAAE